MKTQVIFDYVVTESVKVKDDNGNIESVKKNILDCGMVTAYDEANAKIKVTQKIAEKVDIDEVEVQVRPFCG